MTGIDSSLVDIDDGVPDRCDRNTSKLQMRPGEGDANNRDCEQDRGCKMNKCQDPSGKDEPDDVSNKAQRPRTDIDLAGYHVSSHRSPSEGKEGIDANVEGRTRPRDADNRDGHDQRGKKPCQARPESAQHDPEDVENDTCRSHGGVLVLKSQLYPDTMQLGA